MKNIHIIETDKPSRLAKSTKSGLNAAKKGEGLYESGRFGITTFNIYITNDEEIKDCYYFNSKDNAVRKNNNLNHPYHHKIILTTDQDLIKDGVQAIDNEFLEWFVKNPSCEQVEGKKEQYHQFVGMKKLPLIPNYIIIIPKEEAKQECFVTKCMQLDAEIAYKSLPKQETLEEAAEKYTENFALSVKSAREIGFKDGAKWQQEKSRQNRLMADEVWQFQFSKPKMYSEEDMLEFTKYLLSKKITKAKSISDLEEYLPREFQLLSGELMRNGKELISEWFEQFKKK